MYVLEIAVVDTLKDSTNYKMFVINESLNDDVVWYNIKDFLLNIDDEITRESIDFKKMLYCEHGFRDHTSINVKLNKFGISYYLNIDTYINKIEQPYKKLYILADYNIKSKDNTIVTRVKDVILKTITVPNDYKLDLLKIVNSLFLVNNSLSIGNVMFKITNLNCCDNPKVGIGFSEVVVNDDISVKVVEEQYVMSKDVMTCKFEDVSIIKEAIEELDSRLTSSCYNKQYNISLRYYDCYDKSDNTISSIKSTDEISPEIIKLLEAIVFIDITVSVEYLNQGVAFNDNIVKKNYLTSLFSNDISSKTM